MQNARKILATAALISSCAFAYGQDRIPSILPEPQELTITNKWFTPTKGYQITGMENPDADGVRVLREALPFSSSGLPIEISALKSDDELMRRSGAYTIDIRPEGIRIEIVDGASLFYAAQTIRQLALKEDNGKYRLPECTIKDYPDVLFRGTVEGFYGQPWSHEDRIEQLRFYGKTKLNTYIYGPKDDPYHSSPNWREPYPEDQARHITELAQEAARNKVNFVWAIHPGKDIQWNKTDSLNILSKFEKMYDLGVRSFAVFFDDISGEGAKPQNQANLLNYIHNEFITKKKDVQPLIMCPTEYNKGWAKTDYLDIIGEQLNPAIQVMWTGDRVVADIDKPGLDWVNQRIKRPAYIWWNFPVSDYCQDHLLMGASYGLDTRAAGSMSGFVSNPMEYAEASKVAIFGVGMYTWNIDSYDPIRSWKEACAFIMPEASEAFQTFCEHNADPGPNWHIYRRDESKAYIDAIERYKAAYAKANYDAEAGRQLGALFAKITESSSELLDKCSNKNLLDEIRPWVIQFGYLGQAGTAAIETANAWANKDLSATWENYLRTANMLDSIRFINTTMNQKAQPKGVKVGSRVLNPFLIELHHQTGRNLLATPQVTADKVKMNIPTLLTDVEQLASQHYMEDGEIVGYPPMFETIRLNPGQYIGFNWEAQKEAEYFHFNLPQSNREGRQFEWSADGVDWKKIKVSTESVRDTIRNIDPKARFIRMVNQSNQPLDLNFRAFYAAMKKENVVDREALTHDSNLDTYGELATGQIIKIDCQGINEIKLFTSGKGQITVTGIQGKKERPTLYKGNNGYIRISPKGCDKIEIQADGETRLHEIVKE